MADKNGSTKPAASRAAGAYTINLDNFSKRLNAFYTHWKEHRMDLWGASDVIAIATPPTSEDLRYLKSSALNIWLLGYEFPETIMVFMNKQIHFLCSQKKANLLETVKKSAKEAVGADIIMHVKGKNDVGTSSMEEILHDVRGQSKSDNPFVGCIAKEAPEGKLLETWSEKLHGSALQLSDVTTGFSELFAVKDAKTILRSNNQESKEEQRRQHQAELARQKNEETARRLAGGGSGGTGDGCGTTKASSELIAYKNVNEFPFSRELVIQVDRKNEAVLIPIYGSMVPFHVATVKSVTSHQDNRTFTIRIIFNVPGTPFSPHANTLKNQSAIYLKEITFRSKDPRYGSEVVRQIKALRRHIATRESERAERATLVTQEKLQRATNRMKPMRLPNLSIRPPFGGRGRKLTGTLEAHVNGFQYLTSRPDERVDVMYGNIKHAFFQPAEREMVTLVHFHLHNHIMVGNRKTKDVQFYVEVMDVVQTLGGGRRSATDPDEIEEEQRERKRKNERNMEFQNFVNKLHDHWGQAQFEGMDLEFDQPLRELGFHGVPHKESAFMVPTSTCLVELVELPFVVITLSEIEIVNLERVGLGQKNFDMAMVFKDFKRDVVRIDSIPSTSLDGIKEWLDTADLKYYESRLNLNWRPILKTITGDPEKFIEDGGWEFLNMEVSDSDSDNSEESDQGYQPGDVQSESESEDEDSGSESLVESDEDEEEDSEEEVSSEEDKGKSWEELEREASNADRERGDESGSEEERQRRKVKPFSKSRKPEPMGPPPKRSKFR